jgi:hypothetical protein
MDEGKIIADDIPANVGAVLAQMEHHMFEGMPAPCKHMPWYTAKDLAETWLAPWMWEKAAHG